MSTFYYFINFITLIVTCFLTKRKPENLFSYANAIHLIFYTNFTDFILILRLNSMTFCERTWQNDGVAMILKLSRPYTTSSNLHAIAAKLIKQDRPWL